MKHLSKFTFTASMRVIVLGFLLFPNPGFSQETSNDPANAEDSLSPEAKALLEFIK